MNQNTSYRRFSYLLVFWVYFCPLGLCGQFSGEDVLSPEFYAGRREALREQLPPKSVALFVASVLKERSTDQHYPYEPQADLFYFTGIREPYVFLFIFQNGEEYLFTPPRDEWREKYDGPRLGPEEVEKSLGIAHALPAERLGSWVPPMAAKTMLLDPLPKSVEDHVMDTLLTNLKKNITLGFADIKRETTKLRDIMDQLRGHKTVEELKLLREAIRITCIAHEEVMRSAWVGISELEIEGIHELVHKTYGAHTEGYHPIVASGKSGCILHYQKNDRSNIGAGELILMDVGASYGGYSADITRTFPLGGKFSPAQRLIYEVVLKAQEEAIRICRPGRPVHDITRLSMGIVAEELLKLNIIKKKDQVRNYFPHGATHHIGLETHDRGPYGRDDLMAAGMVLTVEPGIYIPTESPCEEKWWGIAVRIEDDILITADGYENMSRDLPKAPDEIENLVQQEGSFSRIKKKTE
ncbi:MAG: aminopeptidase P N-terminal domain-containing protein [Cytophagales bacterium]|nr:aminopeptidase P N-terminal domain-containing protein [Cytophagales bacterium]